MCKRSLNQKPYFEWMYFWGILYWIARYYFYHKMQPITFDEILEKIKPIIQRQTPTWGMQLLPIKIIPHPSVFRIPSILQRLGILFSHFCICMQLCMHFHIVGLPKKYKLCLSRKQGTHEQVSLLKSWFN